MADQPTDDAVLVRELRDEHGMKQTEWVLLWLLARTLRHVPAPVRAQIEADAYAMLA